MTTYRIAHFIPDPFLGAKLPMGVVVESHGQVHVHTNPHTPDVRCAGGVAHQYAWMRGVELLKNWDAAGLPAGIGPHVEVSAPMDVPEAFDLDTLVMKLFADRDVEPDEGESLARHRGPRRSTLGYQFLKNFGAARHVRKRFRATKETLATAVHLDPISQYSTGAERTILLEPLAFEQRALEDDLRHVATRASAYANAIGLDGREDKFSMVVYLLAGGGRKERHLAMDSLEPFARVVDTTDKQMRDTFFDELRANATGMQAMSVTT